jgi:hypothetical protein
VALCCIALAGCHALFGLDPLNELPDASETRCPDSYNLTHELSSSRYRIEPRFQGYIAQRAMCSRDSADTRLAVLETTHELRVVKTLLMESGAGRAWVGLEQKAGQLAPAEAWFWLTGEPLDSTFWALNQPNDNDVPRTADRIGGRRIRVS